MIKVIHFAFHRLTDKLLIFSFLVLKQLSKIQAEPIQTLPSSLFENIRTKTSNCGFLLQVLRDGIWQEQDAGILVPGDIISIKLGDIIPADARLLEGDPLKIDQVT